MDKTVFISSCKNVTKKRVHRASRSFGIKDFYKSFLKNKPTDKKYDISETQYATIINSINKSISNIIAMGVSVNMPCGMGKFEVRKHEVIPKIDKNGNLKINAPID